MNTAKMINVLIALAMTITSFATSHPLDSKEEIKVSLNQFSILKRLGGGVYGSVYLAKKNGGLDDGRLYALKAINILRSLEYEQRFRENDSGVDLLNNEREVLEAVKGMPWATGLHYAFREGKWSFLIMDLGCGGTLESRLHANRPNATTAKWILAEIITAIENLHHANILHIDLDLENVVINSKGHLLLTDFGRAQRLSCNNATEWDWRYFADMCHHIFYKPHCNKHEIGLINMLKRMTDAQLPEIKNHPYFDGIDWEMVAERKSQPPFEPMETQVSQDCQLDLAEMLGIGVDEELDSTVIERLQIYRTGTPPLTEANLQARTWRADH